LGAAIAAILGWAVLLGAAAAVALVVGRRAAAHGILVAVVVGLALRLVVMLIAHAGSVDLGDHGFLFVDDQTYFSRASRLVDLWQSGRFPDPSRHDIFGTYQFGYELFLAGIFALGTKSVLLGKLVNVLVGGITVYVVARLGGRLLGKQAQVRAAWLAALAPSLVWWSAPLVKEALATLLVCLGVLAVTALPRTSAVATLGAVLAALVLVRPTAAVALFVGAAVALAVVGKQAGRGWVTRPLLVRTAGLLAALALLGLLVSRGHVSGFVHAYSSTIDRMVHVHQGGNLARVPYDAVKSLVTPLPWVFDSGTRNWDRALYPGMWLLLCAYPLAAAGAWRLRRHPEAALLVATAIAAVLVNAFTAGFVFRQRSMIEPLVLLLALAGAPSWPVAGQYVSAALAVVAVVAGVQSRSVVVVLVIAAAAGAVLLVTRRLPARPFDPLPESPMLASFRRGAPSA
jgi:4-amino-4-deoxy-L-arabinose transferase-like glycosyltransferase